MEYAKKPPLLFCALCFLILTPGCFGNPYPYTRQLTNRVAEYYAPRWSPDGMTIAFYIPGFPTSRLSVMNRDGSDRETLADPVLPSNASPDWSPDGRKIVFVSYIDRSGQVYIMDRDGTNVQQITNGQQSVAAPKWSPDGLHIAVGLGDPVTARPRDAAADSRQLDSVELYSMNVDGTDLHQITQTPLGRVFDYEWSPDSKQFVFIAWSGSPLEPDTSTHIYLINADGSNLRQIDEGNEAQDSPTWSPNGKQILFNQSGYKIPGGFYLINADGTGKRLVYHMPACGDPNWSRSTNQLVLICGRNGGFGQIYTLNMADILK